MEKYYYQCKSLTCGHIHEETYKTSIDNCVKCNYSEVTFLASWSLKDKAKNNLLKEK